MRYQTVFSIIFSLFLGTANANWKKINDVNYTWGPFNIYHITLFTETGNYVEGTRPLMLTLQYKKPWEGRDFAVSLARTWNNLGIELPEKDVDEVITRLRKTFPDIKPEDTLHYIALEQSGYFILNDRVVSQVFNKQFNDAIVAIWLDPKMDISRQLLDPSYIPKSEQKQEQQAEQSTNNTSNTNETGIAAVATTNSETDKVETVQTVQEKTAESAQVDEKQGSEKQTTSEKSNVEQVPSTEKAQENVKPDENKATDVKDVKPEETPKIIQIENPELLILPIYDDFLMLQKQYI
ncbi:TPA: dihydroorotate dehydrogenase [Mannheimia haemolytica]